MEDYLPINLIIRGIYSLVFYSFVLMYLLNKKGLIMTQRDMAIYLDIDVKTIRNWRKNKPNLYEIVMLGFASKEILEKSKQNYEELKEFVDKSVK